MPEQPIQSPYVLSMVICDAIWQDPSTGKCTLLGTFSSIGATGFPVMQPQLAVYLAMTDGRGKCPIRLRLAAMNR